MQALRDETTHVLRFSLCSESESSSLIWESPPKTLPGVITNYVPASLGSVSLRSVTCPSQHTKQ